jgi:hypothetical protein
MWLLPSEGNVNRSMSVAQVCSLAHIDVGQSISVDRFKRWEATLAKTVSQFVFKPNPGADMQQLLALVKESAELWRKHGAEVSLWSVQVGEVGNLAFTVHCDSASKMGAVTDGINADPAFAAWRAKNVKAGLASWVRSNQAYQVEI